MIDYGDATFHPNDCGCAECVRDRAIDRNTEAFYQEPPLPHIERPWCDCLACRRRAKFAPLPDIDFDREAALLDEVMGE